MKVDHIGCAVKDIERAMKKFEVLGFEFGEIIDDEKRNVMLSFGKSGTSVIELVSPRNKDKQSSVDEYIKSHHQGVYHICYQSEHFDKDMDECIKSGFKVIEQPKPAIAFDGRMVVFLYSLDLGLIEIVQV